MAADHILAIDQGTTSTRAIVFDSKAKPVAVAQRELRQHYPQLGWVEHDGEDIWTDTLTVVREALASGGVDASQIASIGITNQRETCLLWDRRTSQPIHNAIVWQDRRTAETCAALKADEAEAEVRRKTGLLLDPYFSATKVAWLLDHVPDARGAAERGELAFGTVDSFLLWRLTGGMVHATDVTNAARTLLYDIHRQCWDEELCRLFGVPSAILPEVRDCSGDFGLTAPGLFDRQIPIGGIAGDQQAALVGQACFEPGMAKATYGTGCFMLLHTGASAVDAGHGLLTTPAYRLKGEIAYAVEGSIFIAGAALSWLRDGLGIVSDVSESDALARSVPDSHGIHMVPAFVGLGAPHWDPDARAAIFGLTLNATGAHLVRAALEAVGFQTADLIEAMTSAGSSAGRTLRVDGGMAANDWLCQFVADITGIRVERPQTLETTALGAAFLAGLAAGIWSGTADLSKTWSASGRFVPTMESDRREQLLAGWRAAVGHTRSRSSVRLDT